MNQVCFQRNRLKNTGLEHTASCNDIINHRYYPLTCRQSRQGQFSSFSPQIIERCSDVSWLGRVRVRHYLLIHPLSYQPLWWESAGSPAHIVCAVHMHTNNCFNMSPYFYYCYKKVILKLNFKFKIRSERMLRGQKYELFFIVVLNCSLQSIFILQFLQYNH